jgi:Flp pilus assembly protein TadD
VAHPFQLHRKPGSPASGLRSRGWKGWVDRAPTFLFAAVFLAATLAPLAAQDFSQTQTKPSPQAALTQQANDALAAGDFPAALKLLTTLNTQTPNDPQILYTLGLTLEALEAAAPAPPTPAASAAKIPDAQSYYRQSIDANPLFPAPHVALGLLLARANRAAEARSELLIATALPDTGPALKARAYRALARLEISTGAASAAPQPASPPNPTAAAAHLLAALELTPESPEDILLSAEIAEAAADLPAAEQAYRRSLALDPANPAAVADVAHVLLAQHRPAEAEALLTPALLRAPGDPTLTAQLAAAYLASGDPAKIAQAAPLLESLHAAHPENANIARLLARVYVETGDLKHADPLYAELIFAQSQNGKTPDPTLLDERAEGLLRLHRPGEAETLLKQAIANPAAFPSPAALGDAATHLAFAASEIDDPKVALQALTLRATVLPPSPSTLFLGATANDTLHQSTQAVDLYRQFLAAADGRFPEQESQARQRLAALEHRK